MRVQYWIFVKFRAWKALRQIECGCLHTDQFFYISKISGLCGVVQTPQKRDLSGLAGEGLAQQLGELRRPRVHRRVAH